MLQSLETDNINFYVETVQANLNSYNIKLDPRKLFKVCETLFRENFILTSTSKKILVLSRKRCPVYFQLSDDARQRQIFIRLPDTPIKKSDKLQVFKSVRIFFPDVYSSPRRVETSLCAEWKKKIVDETDKKMVKARFKAVRAVNQIPSVVHTFGWARTCDQANPLKKMIIFMELFNENLYDCNDRIKRFYQQSQTIFKNWCKVSLDIAHALEQMHKKNWRHGDVNPSHILVKTERNQSGEFEIIKAALTDFQMSSKLGEPFASEGSPHFLAPEIYIKAYPEDSIELQKKCEIDTEYQIGPAADLWALGISLYWMHFRDVPSFSDQLVNFLDADFSLREFSANYENCKLEIGPDDFSSTLKKHQKIRQTHVEEINNSIDQMLKRINFHKESIYQERIIFKLLHPNPELRLKSKELFQQISNVWYMMFEV